MTNHKKAAAFLRKRARRILGYGVFFGLALAATILWQSGADLWQQLVSGFVHVVAADSLTSLFYYVKLFLIADVTPVAIAIVLISAGSFAAALLFGGLIVLFLPTRLQPYVDGILLAIPLILLIEGTGLGGATRDRFGGFSSLPLFWLAIMILNPAIWNYLPFGFRYSGSADRKVALPRQIVEWQLVPGDNATEFADLAWVPGDQIEGDEIPVDVVRQSTDSFVLREDYPGRNKQFRELEFTFSEPTAGTTEIEVNVTIGGVSPLAWWDIWCRPFAEDYADHLVAQLTGTKRQVSIRAPDRQTDEENTEKACKDSGG